jgi:PAS domain-containing protein
MSTLFAGKPPSFAMEVFLLCQVFVLAGILFLTIVVRQLQEAAARSQLELEESHRATYKILSVLCDATVNLGPYGEIINASPQLKHLLGTSPNDLVDGRHLTDFLASEYDRSRFEHFLHAPASKAAASALPVDIQPLSGEHCHVTLYHAYSPTLEDQPGHLLGLRETGTGATELPLDATRSRRKRQSRTRSSVSSGTSVPEAVPDAPLVLPIAWPEISLAVDMVRGKLRVCSCTIHYMSMDDDNANETDVLHVPNLHDCMEVETFREFQRYLQTCMNTLAYDLDAQPPAFGTVVLTLPSVVGGATPGVRVRADSVLIEAMEEDLQGDEGTMLRLRLFNMSAITTASQQGSLNRFNTC